MYLRKCHLKAEIKEKDKSMDGVWALGARRKRKN